MALAIADRIRRFHAGRCGDQRHRYRSWEHCHRHFQAAENRSKDDRAVRLASLHLGFYLASWGMYRGSSFLLQKDYLVHEPVVRCLFDKASQPLWDCQDRILKRDSKLVACVVTLVDKIKAAYLEDFRKSRKDRQEKIALDVSNTLATKVLLGTMGCCPAYDDYFVKGVTGTIKPARFGDMSLNAVIAFVGDNRAELLGVQAELAGGNGVRYPLMKLVDMCFWQKGYEEAMANKTKKKGGKV